MLKTTPTSTCNVTTYGGFFWLDSLGEFVDSNGSVLELRPHALAVFQTLVKEPGKLVTKSELVDKVWSDVVVSDDSLVQCISEIRKALRDTQKCVVVTVHRRGYRIVPDRQAHPRFPDHGDILENTENESVLAEPIRQYKLPMVGRSRELVQLQNALKVQSVKLNPLVLISGEPGIGKSRLAEELLIVEGLTGQVAATACASEVCQAISYSTLTSWLREPEIYAAIGIAPISVRREIEFLLPGLIEANGKKFEKSTARPWNRIRFFEAICTVISSAGKRVLLFLDNLQWCDGESIEWLGYALLQSKCEFSVVATLRSGCEQNIVTAKFLSNLARADSLFRLRLGALNKHKSYELAKLAGISVLKEQSASRIFQLTGGYPLFIVEYVRSLEVEGGADQQGFADERILETIRARVGHLPENHKHILSVTAILDVVYDVRIVCHVVCLSTAEVEFVLLKLIDLNLICFDKGSYFVPHDLLREAICALLEPACLRSFQGKVASSIRCFKHHNRNNDEADRYLIGEHYRKAGLHSKAYCCFRQAAQRARKLQSVHTQARTELAALRQLDKLPLTQATRTARIQLLLDFGLTQSVVFGWGCKASYTAWEEAHVLACKLDDLTLRIRSLNALDTWYRDTGNWRVCEDLCQQSIDLIAQSKDRYLNLCIYSSDAALKLHTGFPVLALDAYDQILSKSHNNVESSFNWFNSTFEIGALFRSAQSLWLLGRCDEAYKRADRAIDIAGQRSEPFHQCITLFHVILMYEFAQDHVRIDTLARQLYEIATEYEFSFYQRSAQLSMTLAQALADDSCVENWHPIASMTEELQSAGTRMFEPYWQCNVAKSLLYQGQLEKAHAVAQAALNRSAATHNCFWDSQLWLTVAQCLQARQTNTDLMDRAFEKSVLIAKRQKAGSLEARAKEARANLQAQTAFRLKIELTTGPAG